jgi:hypothetical protein
VTPAWEHIRAFCLFVGYGRSGHSAIGSLIDAHPHAAVAHELHAVKRFFEGVSRDELFTRIYELSQQQALNGRESSRADGGTYEHRLEGQVKDTPASLTLLGDKKGAATAYQFSRNGLDTIDEFTAFIGIPVKMIHVMRNPFDIVAAGHARGGSDFSYVAGIVAEIRRRRLGPDWLDVYYENVIARPREEVARILDFLGLAVLPEHLERCGTYLYGSPHRRRLKAAWPGDTRSAVEGAIARHEHLRRYTWDD